jgi:hypothetical protein
VTLQGREAGTFMNTLDKTPVLPPTHFQMFVKVNLGPVFKEYPKDAVCPDEADQGPRDRGDEKTEPDDENRNDLGGQDGTEEDRFRIGSR